MKKNILFILPAVLMALGLTSCEKDEIKSESVISVDNYIPNEFDLWLEENYRNPYNIDFKYRYEEIESDLNYYTVPATYEASVKMAHLVKYLCVETYNEVAGIEFTRSQFPKMFFLIGEWEYRNNGSFILGTAEGGRIELVENEDGTQYTGQVDLEAGAEFKVITFNAEGNTVWFGGIDETQSGHFLINAGLLGVDINLIDGANFMVEDAGKYNITVMEPVDDRALQEPLVMIVTKEATAISTVGVDTKADNRIFDIMGRELKSVPENGIYIQNGKKYVK